MAKVKEAERIHNIWRSVNSEERVKWQTDSQRGYETKS